MSADAVFPAETARLRLRLLRASDQAFYCSLYKDADTMRHIGPPLDTEHAARCFRAARSTSRRAALQRQPLRVVTFVMIENATRAPIGIGSLQLGGAQHCEAEAGIILHRAARARGYAREALAALVARVFAAWPVDRIWAQHSVHHSLAGRVIGSVGFARGVTTEGGSGRAAMQVWTLDRASWNSNKNRSRIP